MDPTDPWGTLGAHVVKAKGARAEGCKNIASSLQLLYYLPLR